MNREYQNYIEKAVAAYELAHRPRKHCSYRRMKYWYNEYLRKGNKVFKICQKLPMEHRTSLTLFL